MPHKAKKPASPPPDASLLGIPPELRNFIFRLVADDIDEVSIIGRKLHRSKATSTNDSWLWKAMAKHPLSQTCRQLRQEFDPVHRRRALTTGVARYRLELQNFDVVRIKTFSKVIRYTPNIIRSKLKEAVDDLDSIIRFNLTCRVAASIHKLGVNWCDLDSIFSRLQLALNVESIYTLLRSHEVNLNFKERTMSPAEKKIRPTQAQVATAKSDLKRMWKNIDDDYYANWASTTARRDQRRRMAPIQNIYLGLEYTHNNYFRPLRKARAERASNALENRLKVKLRDELKAELRAEIMDELKARLR